MSDAAPAGPESVIARLAARPDVARALAPLGASGERFAQELTAIAQIAAPTFAEQARAEYVAARLRDLGLAELHSDAAGNVLGRLGGHAGAAGIALFAHLDTVFGPDVDVRVTRREGRLFGAGTGDNSSGVTGVLLMLEALHAAGIVPARPLWVVATVGEEGLGDLRGARAAMEELGERAAAVIAVEGALLGRVTHQGVGSRRWRVDFHAPGGHSWHDFGRPSAINAAALAVAAIRRLSVPTDPRTTFNVGRIEGGMGVNVIAAEASLLLDMRSVAAPALAELTRRAEAAIRQAAREEGVEVTFTTVGERPAGGIPRDNPLVATAGAVLHYLQMEPRYEPASTDANIPLSRGVPAVTVGITHGGGVHTEGEWVEIEPATLGVRQLLLLSLALTG